MRIMLALVLCIAAVSLKAQTILPLSFIDYTQRQSYANRNHNADSGANKKLFLTTYSSISTNFIFFNGGNATVVAVPLSLQLNRRINNNLYAFANVSVAPAYISFNRSFLSSDIKTGYQNNTRFNSSNFGMSSKAALGLMYVNDQKTFSISGSIGVERNSYPMYRYNQINTGKANPANFPN